MSSLPFLEHGEIQLKFFSSSSLIEDTVIISQLLLVNPSNHPTKQQCDIPTKVAVAYARVVAVATALAVAVVMADG